MRQTIIEWESKKGHTKEEDAIVRHTIQFHLMKPPIQIILLEDSNKQGSKEA